MVVERRCVRSATPKFVKYCEVKYVRTKAFKLICGIVAKLLRANGGCLGVK